MGFLGPFLGFGQNLTRNIANLSKSSFVSLVCLSSLNFPFSLLFLHVKTIHAGDSLSLILFLKTRVWAQYISLCFASYEQMRWEDIQLWAVSGLPTADQEEIKGMDYDNLNIDESPSILAITTMYQPTEKGWNKRLAIFSDLYVFFYKSSISGAQFYWKCKAVYKQYTYIHI